MTVDVGRSTSRDIPIDLQQDENVEIGRERVCDKRRMFLLGATCLFCLGGNCYLVGHVLDSCKCRCLKKAFMGMVAWNIVKEWKTFKQGYIQAEGEFQSLRSKMKLEKGKEVSNIKCLGYSSLGEEFMWKGTCRRFINDRHSRCRVIYREWG